MGHYTKRLTKVVGALNKASKAHAGQAKTLKAILKDQKSYHSGMKKKGYAMGGAMKRPTANQKGLKKLPTAVRNKMGYMAKGGMTMKKKGMAKGGAMMKKKGMAKGGAARRGR